MSWETLGLTDYKSIGNHARTGTTPALSTITNRVREALGDI